MKPVMRIVKKITDKYTLEKVDDFVFYGGMFLAVGSLIVGGITWVHSERSEHERDAAECVPKCHPYVYRHKSGDKCVCKITEQYR